MQLNLDDKNINLICDLTYGHISGEGSQKDVLFMSFEGDFTKALDMLKQRYGGSWHFALKLNKKENNFKWLEK